jgi:transposase
MTNYKKVENISERRDLVKKLNKEGKSQNEIASITMVSQKTICNDLKAINKNK